MTLKGLQNVPTMFLLQCPCFVEIVLKAIPLALAACTQTLQLFEMISSLLRVWQFGKSRLLLHTRPSPRVVLSTWFRGRAARGVKGTPGEAEMLLFQGGEVFIPGKVSKCWFPLKRAASSQLEMSQVGGGCSHHLPSVSPP